MLVFINIRYNILPKAAAEKNVGSVYPTVLMLRERAMPDFSDLLEPQIPRLRRYARALTRDTHRADDLVQDTLVRALAKQDRWEPGTNLRAWLFTLMHNQYVNDMRRGNRDAGAIDIDEVSASLVATTDPTASRQLHELERALGQLPAEQREVILLVGLEGLSYDDAAATLAVPIGTVRSRLSRGREALRRQLGMEEAIDPTPASTKRPVLSSLEPRHELSEINRREGIHSNFNQGG
jgi:RNA polymerase sigma-70 factor, ECF subfamily